MVLLTVMVVIVLVAGMVVVVGVVMVVMVVMVMVIVMVMVMVMVTVMVMVIKRRRTTPADHGDHMVANRYSPFLSLPLYMPTVMSLEREKTVCRIV